MASLAIIKNIYLYFSMKNYLLPLVCLFCGLASHSQYKLGYAGENREGDLEASDPVNGKQHYQFFPVSMKKGQAALFFMHSDVLKPYVLLATPAGQLIAQGDINRQETESQVSMFPDRDTSILLILTSAEENKTGKFNFGYKLLDSSQMIFKESYTICEKLAFLMNQWRLEWKVMPATKEFFFDLDERLADSNVSLYYTAAKYRLMGAKARLAENYKEILYSEVNDSAGASISLYQKVVKDIKDCLDLDVWMVEEKEQKVFEDGLSSVYYQTTYFYAKGYGKNDHLFSFKIVREAPGFFSIHSYKVSLIFN